MEELKSPEYPDAFVEKGRNIEREKSSVKFALTLFKENMPIDFIVRTTELSENKVLKLKKYWDEGREAGRDEGQEEGHEKSKDKIALNLFAENMSIDFIQRTTELSEKQVLKLKKKWDKGREIGREEGRRKSKEKIALNLLAENMSIDFIVRATELSKEEVLELKGKP